MRTLLSLILLPLLLSTLCTAQVYNLYYSDSRTANSDGSVTITPTVSISGTDQGYCSAFDGYKGYETPAVMVNNNPWATGAIYPSGTGNSGTHLSWSYTFPAVVVAPGQTVDLSYAGKVEGDCYFQPRYAQPPSGILNFYLDSFVDGTGPTSPYPAPCWILQNFTPGCVMPWPDVWSAVLPHAVHSDLASQQVAQLLPIPTSETTYYYGNYHITEGSFVMALNPGTLDFDGFYVNEFDYAQGTNTCWWPGANFVQYPSVEGSYWTVGENGSAHDQYGLDSIGFANDTVSTIQSQGLEHDVDFPCVVTIYQEMTYDLFYDYAENVDTQTIGSTTVQVCRTPQVCTPVIQF